MLTPEQITGSRPEAGEGRMTDLILRASDAPMAFLCPGSVRQAEVPASEPSAAAGLGSAVHEALRPLAEGAGIPWDELEAIAGRWGVGADDLRALCAVTAKLWPALAPLFPNAATEVPLSAEPFPGLRLTGHADVLATVGTSGRGADWKTGRLDHDYGQQMRAYAALILLDDPALTEATVTIVWIRAGEVEHYTMDRSGLRVWLAALREVVAEWDGTYRPGPHCARCRRSHECPAAHALARRDAAAILDADELPRLDALGPVEVLALYRRARLVKQCGERVLEAIRSHIEEHGEIATDDGRLALTPEPRRELDVQAAWPVLEEHGFRDADFAQVIDLSVSRLEKLVAQKAGRGKGAAAVRAIQERLAAAGAVRTHEVHKLTVKR